MSIEIIAPIAAMSSNELSLAPIVPTGVSSSNAFGSMVTQGLNQVNQQLISSQSDLQGLALGDVQNLHQVMIKLEESRISFQLMVQVRNRLLEAYQDVMKMPV
jgi:flagellar hook-basal body complex protein FliE